MLHPLDVRVEEAWRGRARIRAYTTPLDALPAPQAHDVLALKRGPANGTLLFKIWRWGSSEAAAFSARLNEKEGGRGKGKSPAAKKRGRSHTPPPGGREVESLFDD